MDEQIRYIIVAEINGAKKSTLYRARPELFTHSERLNANEILQKMGGNNSAIYRTITTQKTV